MTATSSDAARETVDERSFRAAIRANPLDRTARLVFADYLDDRDRPLDAARERVLAEPDSDAHRLHFADVCEQEGQGERAEFVRVQCRLAAIAERDCRDPECSRATRKAPMRYCPECLAWSDEKSRLHEREAWILLDRGREWGPRLYTFRFARGFVETLTCTAADFLASADAILAQHPVRKVELTTWPNERVANAPDDRLYSLDGIEGEFSLRHDLWPVLNLEGKVRALRVTEVTRGVLAVRFPGVAFTLPADDSYPLDAGTRSLINSPILVTAELLNDAAVNLPAAFERDAIASAIETFARRDGIVPQGDAIERFAARETASGESYATLHTCHAESDQPNITERWADNPISLHTGPLFDRIDCRRYNFAIRLPVGLAGGLQPTRFRCYVGRCARCQRSFVSNPVVVAVTPPAAP